uniref:Uncharacterized protein n=1 Tax=Triticum urartu TaxID=4572 RepID=A0A8R7U4P1_TRIUA
MLGRALASGCAHHSPITSTSSTSRASNSPHSASSAASSTAPRPYIPHAHSTSRKILVSPGGGGAMSRLPVATSTSTTPKLYTSDSLLAFPVAMHSGSRYPGVPATAVMVCRPTPWSMSRARPKSPSLAPKDSSSIMLLGFMSPWTTHWPHSSCRYSTAAPSPRMILYLAGHGSTAVAP